MSAHCACYFSSNMSTMVLNFWSLSTFPTNCIHIDCGDWHHFGMVLSRTFERMVPMSFCPRYFDNLSSSTETVKFSRYLELTMKCYCNIQKAGLLYLALRCCYRRYSKYHKTSELKGQLILRRSLEKLRL